MRCLKNIKKLFIVPVGQGILVFNNDGTYTFTPAANFTGVVSVDYQVCDAGDRKSVV